MKLKKLITSRYVIASIIDGDDKCPVSDFLKECGNSNFERSHAGLLDLLKRVAGEGLSDMPSSLSHRINDDPPILEFIKGKLRLIYFRGEGNMIVIATEIVQKKTGKADKKAVSRAISAYREYCEGITSHSISILEGELNDEN